MRLRRVKAANPGSGACVDSTPGDLLVTAQAAGLAVVMLVAGILLVAQLIRLRGGGSDRQLVRIVDRGRGGGGGAGRPLFRPRRR